MELPSAKSSDFFQTFSNEACFSLLDNRQSRTEHDPSIFCTQGNWPFRVAQGSWFVKLSSVSGYMLFGKNGTNWGFLQWGEGCPPHPKFHYNMLKQPWFRGPLFQETQETHPVHGPLVHGFSKFWQLLHGVASAQGQRELVMMQPGIQMGWVGTGI